MADVLNTDYAEGLVLPMEDESKIFSVISGSKFKASKFKEINNNITLLDIGSGFDPIFGEKTRPKQPSAEKCFEYYSELLPKDYKFKKTAHAINRLNKTLANF